ncbi:MAG: hypothetical protein MRERC_7c060 [Mycoplasmataceae bacterium RC_NB112A]|nr:MAG: hypothetical protein MRERC_8c059 [Mycoplasmataceae bacterium RC_NB112A]KLL01896.1 MAG: hypothetical protein MRERC_7c060 [Mycoplasmataceae bacterium RC_NB112A]
MLQIENRHWEIVQNILTKYPYQFYAYGSRAKRTARFLSDLDLCYYDNISSGIIYEIREEFAQSNLPFMVELVNWKNMRSAFQKSIKKDLKLISVPVFQGTKKPTFKTKSS